MRFGATDDDHTIDIPDQPASFDDQAASVTFCAGEIIAGAQFPSSDCIPFGTLHGSVDVRVNYSCGVHLYGSATHRSWFALPIPTIGGSVSGTGAAVGISFSWLHYHDSNPLADPQTEDYNGACLPPDQYSPGSGGGGEGSTDCPDADVYMWFHFNPETDGYDYMGDVCIDNGRITRIQDMSPAGGSHLGSAVQSAETARFTADAKLRGSSEVTLALMNALPGGAHALVVRRLSKSPAQLILLDSTATAQDLQLALGTLGALRALDGDVPSDTIATPRGRLSETGRGSAMNLTTRIYLSRLGHARTESVEGYGDARTLEIEVGHAPTIRH
ncbi:MAG TPA: hypothetical protein VN651_03710 [Gemmatimonadaceae bacterium]|nr:hypothetical protein [Gemmatimonadaceae bacterium]